MPLATLRYQLSLSLSAARVASYPLCVCKTTNLFLLFAVLKMFKGCLPAILLSLLVAMASPQADEDCFRYIKFPPSELECNPYLSSLKLQCTVMAPSDSSFEIVWFYQGDKTITSTVTCERNQSVAGVLTSVLEVNPSGGSIVGEYYCQIRLGNGSWLDPSQSAMQSLDSEVLINQGGPRCGSDPLSAMSVDIPCALFAENIANDSIAGMDCSIAPVSTTSLPSATTLNIPPSDVVTTTPSLGGTPNSPDTGKSNSQEGWLYVVTAVAAVFAMIIIVLVILCVGLLCPIRKYHNDTPLYDDTSLHALRNQHNNKGPSVPDTSTSAPQFSISNEAARQSFKAGDNFNAANKCTIYERIDDPESQVLDENNGSSKRSESIICEECCEAVCREQTECCHSDHAANEGIKRMDETSSVYECDKQDTSAYQMEGDYEQSQCTEQASDQHENTNAHNHEQTDDPYDRDQLLDSEQQQRSDQYDMIQAYEQQQTRRPYDMTINKAYGTAANTSTTLHNEVQSPITSGNPQNEYEKAQCYEQAGGRYEKINVLQNYEQTNDPYDCVCNYEQRQGSGPYEQVQEYERQQASGHGLYEQIQTYEVLPHYGHPYPS